MKRVYSFLATMSAAVAMVVLTYLFLRPVGLQRTVDLFQNFFGR